MTQPEAFNELRSADSGELLVVADYAATGRPAASFHDLVPLLSAPLTVWETAPAPWGTEAGMTGQDQAQRWLDEIRASGMRVRALLGFCGGGVYAGVMAQQLADRQGTEPRLVLFDPGFAERRMLREHLENFTRRLQKAFDDEQLAQMTAALDEADAAAPDPLELAGQLSTVARTLLAPAVIRAGWSEETAADTAAKVTGYLHWLAGAASLDPTQSWKSAAAINSNNPDIGLNAMPEPQRSTIVAEAHYFDLPHAQLLKTPEVAALADKLIG